MKLRRAGWGLEAAGLIAAGLSGLAVAGVYACGSDTASPTADAGVSSSDGSSSGTSSSSGSSSGAGSSSGSGSGSSSGSGIDGGIGCVSDPAAEANAAAVVAAVNTLLAALTTDQQTAVHYDRTRTNAIQWSNFPAGVVPRNGVKMGDMSAAAQTAAVALVQAAAGSNGVTLFNEIRGGDDAYAGIAGDSSLFGNGNYYVSIHGTPSPTADWMLQIAGHHVAYNFTYAGKCTSATPLFDGVQPSTWTDANNQAHAPLEGQRSAVAALLSSVSALAGAQLSGTFTDMINGPSSLQGGSAGGNDSKYPSGLTYPTGSTGRGVSAATLSSAQKDLVKAAIEAWVKNVADPVANSLLAVYETDEALAQTYIGYSGQTDLSTTSSYARIDGPRVWIEFTVQEGTSAASPQGHYHTIWRDKVADYGADFVQ